MKLTTGSVYRRIFYFALPMLTGNVFQQLYNVINAVIVGKYVGKEALAGVLASSQAIFVVASLIMGIGMGGTVVIAQYYGAKDYRRTQQTSDTVMLFLLIASVVVGGLCAVFCEEILGLLHVPADAMPAAESYLRIYFIGLVGMFGHNGSASLLRGVGDSKTPFYALIVACLLNIVLDFVFVLGCNMGAAGTAWATVAAQMLSWLLLWRYANRKINVLHFNLLKCRFNADIFKRCMNIGIPTGLQQTFVQIGMAALFGMVNTFGVDVSAGYGAAIRIDSFIAIPAMTFSGALSTFVAQNIGANRPSRLRKGLFATLWMAGGVSIAITILVLIFKHSLIGWFTDAANTEVIAAGASYLTIVCSFYVVFAGIFVVQGFLRGAGASVAPMVISLVSLWLIRIPIAYFLTEHTQLGYAGIFWSIPVAWLIGLGLSVWYYLSGRWRRNVVAVRIANMNKTEMDKPDIH
jgi:putative MATE family efflux protein